MAITTRLKCTSCGASLVGAEGFVKMLCPQCREATIIRCKQCRRLANKYRCEKCGFEGP